MGAGSSRWKLHSHSKKSEENGIDPDDGNRWKCDGCTLPIFSTPFIKRGRSSFVHDECANLPEILMDHVLHRGQPLTLKEEQRPYSRRNCSKCSEGCGSMMYQCLDSSCDLHLDLLCSLPIKILHRSHEHRVMAIRGSASFICGACGTQHQGRVSAPISYLCTACDFWIHTDCASAPNAIKVRQPKHEHHLFLTYHLHLAASSSADDGFKCAICRQQIFSNLGAYICIKCRYYAHIGCATSHPHEFKPVLIRNAKLADLLHLPMADEGSSIVQHMLENTSAGDGHDDEEKKGKEEKQGNEGSSIVQHMLENTSAGDGHDDEEKKGEDEGKKEEKQDNEGSSIVQHMLENTSAGDGHDDEEKKGKDEGKKEEKQGNEGSSILQHMLENTSAGDGHDDEEEEEGEEEEEEELYGQHDLRHPLILDEDDEDADSDDDDGTGHSSSRVCNGCGELISGRPFYRCSECRDFVLHSCCANLPSKIEHPFHQHALSLSTKVLDPCSFSTIGFDCKGCKRTCSGFAYTCKTCFDFSMDVLCALMPASITHASHGKTHILSMSWSPWRSSGGSCSCCNLDLDGMISYECTNCRHLKLHAHCALLPTTITHSFDVHPLNLTTSLITNHDIHTQHFCEVCEEDINQMCWYYSCNYCHQSFHIHCIPFLDSHSRIKFGVTVYLKIHHCPLTLVRENALSGYCCYFCELKFKCQDNPPEARCAYECSKCNYRIHEACALSEFVFHRLGEIVDE